MGCSFTPSASSFDGQSPARRGQFASLSPNSHHNSKHSSVCCAGCRAAKAHLTTCRAPTGRPVPLAQTLLGQAKQRIIDLPMLETPSSQHLPTRHRVEEIVMFVLTPREHVCNRTLRRPWRLLMLRGLLTPAVSTLMRGLLNFASMSGGVCNDT